MFDQKLYTEVMQGMQDLTSLFEKAIALESKLYSKCKELSNHEVPEELCVAMDIQADKLHDMFDRLEEAMDE